MAYDTYLMRLETTDRIVDLKSNQHFREPVVLGKHVIQNRCTVSYLWLKRIPFWSNLSMRNVLMSI